MRTPSSRFVALALLAAGVFALAACGRKDSGSKAGGGATTPAAAEGAAASPNAVLYRPDPTTAATLAGKASFTGERPKALPIDVTADPVCSAAHESEKLVREDFVGSEGGGLRWVFVYAKPASKALANLRFEPPKEEALLDQHGCAYQPHAFGVMAGQTIRVRNSDPTSHNIKCTPRKNAPFNFSQVKKGLEETRAFERPEYDPPVRLECNVHPWMNAQCAVFPHPFFAVTGEDGSYRIEHLPPGEYEIVAWHESRKHFGAEPRQTQSVTLAPKEEKSLDFSFAIVGN